MTSKRAQGRSLILFCNIQLDLTVNLKQRYTEGVVNQDHVLQRKPTMITIVLFFSVSTAIVSAFLAHAYKNAPIDPDQQK
jgi:hypothetical protein